MKVRIYLTNDGEISELKEVTELVCAPIIGQFIKTSIDLYKVEKMMITKEYCIVFAVNNLNLDSLMAQYMARYSS